MRNLHDLLKRIAKSLNKDALIKESVIEVIEIATTIRLSEKNLTIKEGILEITAGPALKNEIRLKEEGVRNELRERKIPISRILYK